MATAQPAPQLLSTWFKLLIGIVSMLIGLIVFKVALSYHGSPLLDPFYSFVVLVAISVGAYYLLHAIALRRAKNSDPQEK